MSVSPAGDELSVTALREQLGDVVSRASFTGHATYVTKHHRRVAAVVSAEDAELLEELEDRGLAELARRARAEMDEGEPSVRLDDLDAELAE